MHLIILSYIRKYNQLYHRKSNTILILCLDVLIYNFFLKFFIGFKGILMSSIVFGLKISKPTFGCPNNTFLLLSFWKI